MKLNLERITIQPVEVIDALEQLSLSYAKVISGLIAEAKVVPKVKKPKTAPLTEKDRRIATLVKAHFAGSGHLKFLSKFAALIQDKPELESLIMGKDKEKDAEDSFGGRLLAKLKTARIINPAWNLTQGVCFKLTRNPNGHSYPLNKVIISNRDDYAVKLRAEDTCEGNHYPGINSGSINSCYQFASEAEVKEFFKEIRKRVKPHDKSHIIKALTQRKTTILETAKPVKAKAKK
jgi:hypothetical protein